MPSERKITFKRVLTYKQTECLKKTFLKDDGLLIIKEDMDGYDINGDLLFKFRKNRIPFDVLKSGYESFKDSIELTDGRGGASGASKKRIRSDGTISNITIGNFVESGNVGFMDSNAMIKYCRKTAFARDYFDKFKAGVPFVKYVDNLYKELCPEHYKLQKSVAEATNKNWVIEDTSFTTVTVNRNFQTAVHKDAGDFPKGFGNLCVYREGDFNGAYFCLPEYGVGIDMQNTDILFVDVHRWHGNTPFIGENYLRIAFVMYYREYMYKCKGPKEELQRVKMEQGGFFKL